MIPLLGLLVEPKESKRYNNTENIGGHDLIINTHIDEKDFKYVQRIGVIKKLPYYDNWGLQVGDEVVVHHNTFRKYWGFNCNMLDGDAYFNDGQYICNPDQVFMYNRNNEGWKCLFSYCFVSPIEANRDGFIETSDKYKENIGILRYGNKYLEELGIQEGDTVGLTPSSNYIFNIDNEVLYKMRTKDIYATVYI